MPNVQRITPFLWFDTQAEEAAKFYTGIFKNSKITKTAHYSEAGKEFHGKPPGSVLTVGFELEGQHFTALNGGPQFKFTEAISFVVHCETQAEVDHYWEKLGAGGDPAAQQCGWLKDKFGLSWQIVPNQLIAFLTDPDRAKAGRVMQVMMGMKKLNIAALEKAAAG
ncbi:MAG TPA: VOC family protein [Pirellulales bacterium]|jgi:predicted 3-demethylubiquinone-9 3-methyltransferase (glyoxalase superfamily)|nr:VOC family protein [Pirellulales bacterium]